MQDIPGKYISIIHRKSQVYWAKTLKDWDISSAEYPVLIMLNQKDGITQEDIVSELVIDKAAVARIIQTMQEKQFIIKKKDEADLRCNRIYLTEKGRSTKDALEQGKKGWNAILTKNMSEDERAQIMQFLTKMVENIKE